jgi:hypothetical protein
MALDEATNARAAENHRFGPAFTAANAAAIWTTVICFGRFHASYYQLSNFRQGKIIFILLRKSFARFAGMLQGSGHESKRRPSSRAM